ncbi:hypothetical protein HU200_064965 [Digitaria exilis]|uniref:Aldehyde dehydrogenase domain-containing protein n=1 Tax=Digitaria exilis TaxID=1010633 RepID=A0A835DU75_9POAL|nr:hypothetical protein HU200_064965 [Digitaria exilis]
MASERNGGGNMDLPAAAAEEKGGVPPFEAPEIRFTKLFINGCFVDAVSGRTFETRDPRTGDVIATVAEGDKEDVDLAVKAARDAFDHGEWPRMSGSERGRIMTRFADLVERHADELATLESLDAGKHPAVTKAVDIGNAAGSLRYFAGAADKIHGETLKMQAQFQAYLDMAVELAVSATFFNKGEACVAASRVYVQESIYDRFEKKLAERMKSWVVGDPLNDPRVNQGPQVDKAQYERVLGYIDHGKREGATLLTGGKPCGQKGYYIEPTVFSNVKEDMIIAKEEIFGPVMCLMKFKTVEEAIGLANGSRYGLGAGVVTRDLDVANQVVRSVRAGLVWVNCYFAVSSDCPFGGRGMSGFGKDEGMHALDKFLAVKCVVTPLRGSPWM